MADNNRSRVSSWVSVLTSMITHTLALGLGIVLTMGAFIAAVNNFGFVMHSERINRDVLCIVEPK